MFHPIFTMILMAVAVLVTMVAPIVFVHGSERFQRYYMPSFTLSCFAFGMCAVHVAKSL